MPDLTKIATCNYCGTRSILRLSGKVQHELACTACGAKLHNMKPLRVDRTANRVEHVRPQRRAPLPPPRKHTRRKRSTFSRLADFLEDVWDEVEDIFD